MEGWAWGAEEQWLSWKPREPAQAEGRGRGEPRLEGDRVLMFGELPVGWVKHISHPHLSIAPSESRLEPGRGEAGSHEVNLENEDSQGKREVTIPAELCLSGRQAHLSLGLTF